MRSVIYAAALIGSVAGIATGQQPDSLAKRDSIQKAQTDSAMRADSITLERELGRIANEPRNRTIDPARTVGPTATTQGPTNPTLLPNISAIGDLVFDLSPDGSTQETGARFLVREVELGIQAAVDPYFRGDFFLGVHGDAVEVEEAYLSTLALPWQTQVRLGRFLLPFGKQNTTHRPELHTIEHSRPVQEFLGEEGGKGTGVWFSKIFAPLGFYQELQAAVVDAFATEPHGEEHGDEHVEEAELITSEPANKSLAGLGYAARLRNYWDLGEATNLEVSGSFATGKQAVGVSCETAGSVLPTCPGDVTAVNARQSLIGADMTYRWRPLQQGLYRSLIVQAEWMRQMNPQPGLDFPSDLAVTVAGARESFDGAYVMARYQLTRRTYAGGRFDWLQEPEEPGHSLTAASAYLIFYPSEFSKMVAMYEHVKPPFEKGLHRLVFQTTFAVGPHRPHPF